MSILNLPVGLEVLKPYLQRANEVESRNPLVAYYCRTYAAQLGIEAIQKEKSTNEQTTFVLKLMDELEKEKDVLNPEAEAGRATVELFSLTMFGKAEKAFENGRCDKVLAKIFYTASILMEVCKQFGELDQDLANKQKYARWRAAQITKAVNSGETITFSRADSKNYDEGNSDSMDTSTDDFEKLQNSFNQQFASNRNVSPSPTAPHRSQQGRGIDHKSNMQTNVERDNANNPSLSRAKENSNIYQNSRQENVVQKSVKVPIQETTSSTMSTYVPQQSNITDDAIDEAQKLTKYALSALQFSDVPVAIHNLKSALNLLGYPC